MTALWWALGAAVLIFAARALVDAIQRRDRGRAAPAPEPTPQEAAAMSGAPGLMISTKPLTRHPRDPQLLPVRTTTPVYFVSATAFNLLGIDRWVRNLRFVNYYDSFDGTHPNVFVPKEQTPRAFTSIEEIVNYLLGHKEVGDLVTAQRRRGQGGVPDVRRGDRAARGRARARRRVPAGVAPPPDGLEDRDDAARQRGRRPERAEHDGSRHRLPGVARSSRPTRGPRRGPRRADPVRRLRADDVLHRERGRLAGGREEDRRPRHQGDEADRAARARDRGRDHASRHAGRAADGRAHRVPRAHALRRRLVRQRRLARAAHREAAARRARAHDRDGRTPAPGGVPRLLRARFPARCGRPATCGSASSTRG